MHSTLGISIVVILIYTFGLRETRAEALGADCDVNQEVPLGRVKVITFNGSAPLNVSCNDMIFRSTDQHMLCIRNQIFNDPDCAVNLRFTDTKSGQVGTFNCNKSETFCTKPNGTLHIQFGPRDNKSPRNALLTLILYTKNGTLSEKENNTKGINCNETWNVPFGRIVFINFNGSAPYLCNELKFRSTGQHKLCIKSQLFQDPDCAVNLRLNDTKSGQVETFNCNKTETFCTKPTGTLHIQFGPRDNKSLSNALLNLILYTKNGTLPGKEDDEIDWELLTILLRTLIPLFFFLVFGVVSVVCIYMQRKKRRAQYMGKSADGSTPTPFSFGSPALENYPTAPPPQQFSSFEPAKSY